MPCYKICSNIDVMLTSVVMIPCYKVCSNNDAMLTSGILDQLKALSGTDGFGRFFAGRREAIPGIPGAPGTKAHHMEGHTVWKSKCPALCTSHSPHKHPVLLLFTETPGPPPTMRFDPVVILHQPCILIQSWSSTNHAFWSSGGRQVRIGRGGGGGVQFLTDFKNHHRAGAFI